PRRDGEQPSYAIVSHAASRDASGEERSQRDDGDTNTVQRRNGPRHACPADEDGGEGDADNAERQRSVDPERAGPTRPDLNSGGLRVGEVEASRRYSHVIDSWINPVACSYPVGEIWLKD